MCHCQFRFLHKRKQQSDRFRKAAERNIGDIIKKNWTWHNAFKKNWILCWPALQWAIQWKRNISAKPVAELVNASSVSLHIKAKRDELASFCHCGSYSHTAVLGQRWRARRTRMFIKRPTQRDKQPFAHTETSQSCQLACCAGRQTAGGSCSTWTEPTHWENTRGLRQVGLEPILLWRCLLSASPYLNSWGVNLDTAKSEMQNVSHMYQIIVTKLRWTLQATGLWKVGQLSFPNEINPSEPKTLRLFLEHTFSGAGRLVKLDVLFITLVIWRFPLLSMTAVWSCPCSWLVVWVPGSQPRGCTNDHLKEASDRSCHYFSCH